MNLPKDFKEFIELAISAKLQFLVIGGWAFNRYAEPRMTGDIDFFINDAPESDKLVKHVVGDSMSEEGRSRSKSGSSRRRKAVRD